MLGAQLKAIRTERKLTQAKLAKITNISEETLSCLERNKYPPCHHTLMALIEKGKMDPRRLLLG